MVDLKWQWLSVGGVGCSRFEIQVLEVVVQFHGGCGGDGCEFEMVVEDDGVVPITYQFNGVEVARQLQIVSTDASGGR